MIPSVDKLIEYIRLNKVEVFTVSLAKDNGKTYVFKSEDDEGIENAITRFRNVMELSQGGKYYFEGKNNKFAARGNFAEEFANLPQNAPTQAQNTPGLQAIGAVPADEVEQRIKKAIEDYEIKKELEELRATRAELEKQTRELDNTWNRILQRSEPYVGMILSHLVGKVMPTTQVGVAGLEPTQEHIQAEDNNTEITYTPMEERIQKALEKWSAADADFIVLLEKIATMASEKDPMYNMAKSFLNK